MEKLGRHKETSMSAEMQDSLFASSEASRDAEMLKEKLARYREARTSMFDQKQDFLRNDNTAGSASGMLAEKQSTAEEANLLAKKLENYTAGRARKLKENPNYGKNTNTLIDKLERFRKSRGFQLDQYEGRLPINSSPYAEVRMA